MIRLPSKIPLLFLRIFDAEIRTANELQTNELFGKTGLRILWLCEFQSYETDPIPLINGRGLRHPLIYTGQNRYLATQLQNIV